MNIIILQLNIIGYADKFSVRPNEEINFMISCKSKSYNSTIVKLIHGDDNIKGPGFKEKIINNLGKFNGRKQILRSGSHIVIKHNSVFSKMKDFTLHTWIYPTLINSTITSIITKCDNNVGYKLFIDEKGCLSFFIGDPKSNNIVKIKTSLISCNWYFIAVTYDSKNNKLTLFQYPLISFPSYVNEKSEILTSVKDFNKNNSEMLISGCWDYDVKEKFIKSNFNGKITSVLLINKVLTLNELILLKNLGISNTLSKCKLQPYLIGHWDFSININYDVILDLSKNNLKGIAVNKPKRAVTSYNWSGKTTNFNEKPNEYNAIYFHDDDLDNANWKVDFKFKISNNLSSGVYAAKLSNDNDEDYIPFFVKPKKNKINKILFLAPTFSYMAYANEHLLSNKKENINFDQSTLVDTLYQIGKEINYPIQKQDKYVIKNNLTGLYDYHSDGSGVCFSSRLRPILNMRPKYNMQLLSSAKGSPHQFNADLHLINWLEDKSYKYDVVTDEDLHFEGLDLINDYKVIITGTHPEYWSESMLNSVEKYLKNGGRIMYLGGNGFYWVTSVFPDSPHIIEVRRSGGTGSWEEQPGDYYHSSTGELGGLWRNRGKPPQKLVGIGFTAQGMDKNSPYYRQKDSYNKRAAFIFKGIKKNELIGNFESLVLNFGAAGFELDRMDKKLGTPKHTLLLASSKHHSESYAGCREEIPTSPKIDPIWLSYGHMNPRIKADMVYFEYPNNGAAFSVGSISWCGSLSYNNSNNNVSLITENVLKNFIK